MDVPATCDGRQMMRRCRLSSPLLLLNLLLLSPVMCVGDSRHGSVICRQCTRQPTEGTTADLYDVNGGPLNSTSSVCEQSCFADCDVWTAATKIGCHSACTEATQEADELQSRDVCIEGCSRKLASNVSTIIATLCGQRGPSLVAGTKTNASVQLQWVHDDVTADDVTTPVATTFRVQRLVVGRSDDWRRHDDVTWLPGQRLRLGGLRPYVTYKFRLAIPISTRPEVYVTLPESAPIATEPSGVPMEAPRILSVTASSASLHVRWEAPFFVGAPLLGYRLTVSAAGPGGGRGTGDQQQQGVTRVKEMLAADHRGEAAAGDTGGDGGQQQQQHGDSFTMLRSDTDYALSVAAMNQFGVGPAAEVTTRTQPAHGAGVDETTAYLLIAADNKLLLQDLSQMFAEPHLVYEDADETVVITAVAIHVERRSIYFSTTRGDLWRLNNVTISGGPDGGGDRPRTSGSAAAASGAGRGGRRRYGWEEQLPQEQLLMPGSQPAAGQSSSDGTSGISLTVDWLYQRLYIAQDDSIMQCDLDAKDCQTAIDHLPSPPLEVHADPCNGYFYWSQKASGIYRTGLSKPGGLVDLSTRRRIVGTQSLETFVIDHLNYRLFYPAESRNSLVSVDMDGSEDPVPIRNETFNGEVVLMTSLVYFEPGEVFFWVNAGQLQMEELDTGVYHQNDMLIDGAHFGGLAIWHPSSQPIPVPVTSPTDLQALFSVDSATFSWLPPEQDQGPGAWSEWLYEVHLTHGTTNATLRYGDVQSTNLTVHGLAPASVYTVRVRATSSAGGGPWSQDFTAQTLKPDSAVPYLIYVNGASMHKTTLNRSVTQLVADLSKISSIIKEVSAFAHVYIMVTENGSVYTTFEGQPLTLLSSLHDVGVLAFDWLTDTLYWTNSKLNIIQRLSFSRAISGATELTETVHHSSLPILDLVLDGLRGYMYWTTSSTVELAHLDGQSHDIILRLPNFSDRFVLSIAVSGATSGGELNWIVREPNDRISLYASPLADDSAGLDVARHSGTVRLICHVTGSVILPSIELYSNKVLWISGVDTMSVLDINACHVARMQLPVAGGTAGRSHRLSAFMITHSTKYMYPENFNKSNTVVIPGVVDLSNSLQVLGSSDTYTVQWSPVAVQHGSVYYKVLLQLDGQRQLEQKSDAPFVSVAGETKSYAEQLLAVKACTYWGCSDQVQKKFRSPMGAPSVPQRLRAFVTFQRGRRSKRRQLARVDLRWSRPAEPGGIISSYLVFVTSDLSRDSWNNTKLSGEQLATRFTMSDVPLNSLYHFKVQACTPVACSPLTEISVVNTSVEKPLPKLITSVNDSICIVRPDDDGDKSLALVQSPIVALCYIAHDDSLYWIDKNGRIMSNGGGGGRNKSSRQESLAQLGGRGRSIAADWVGRDLYWLEEGRGPQNAIMKYDLNLKPDKSNVVLSRPGVALGIIQVSPSRRSLYWTETPTNGRARLMRCYMNGSDPQPVLQQHQSGEQRYRYRPLRSSTSPVRPNSSACSCPDLSLSPTFALDQTAVLSVPAVVPDVNNGGDIYVVDADTGDIWAVDALGCNCRLVINASTLRDSTSRSGLPPDSLTIDQDRIYWSSDSQRVMNSVDKFSGLDFIAEGSSAGGNVVAVGENLQPMPDSDCLKIARYTGRASLVSSTNTTLLLRLPPWKPPENCRDISWPSVKYTVHFKRTSTSDNATLCDRIPASCSREETYDTNVLLPSLEPFSTYLIQVQASNYYTETPAQLSLANTEYFETKHGIPSPARDVEATPYSPMSVSVTWVPPVDPHGPSSDIKYDVEWYAYNDDGSRSEGRVAVDRGVVDDQTIPRWKRAPPVRNNLSPHSSLVTGLKPSHTYVIRVLCYNDNVTGWSASAPVSVTTYQSPGIVELVSKTSTSLNVSWLSSVDDSVVRHGIQYAKVGEQLKWLSGSQMVNTTNATAYYHVISGLSPLTGYTTRVRLVYRSGLSSFWPPSLESTFSTSADVPGKPGSAWVSDTNRGRLSVHWMAPSDNGSPIQQYHLRARLVSEANNWTLVFNGSNREWPIPDSIADRQQEHVFQVAARNLVGWGQFSNNSLPFDIAGRRSLRSSDQAAIVLAASLSILLFLCAVVICIIFMICRQRRENKENVVVSNGIIVRNTTDHELATLRELPSVTVQTSNALYGLNSVSMSLDVASLKHFHRDQIKLTMFLGSGAFGEVFEGVATDILSENSGNTKVAVKTLHKNANEAEKDEFLQEALLMSNFKHEHILQLLGVCLNNDPQFIILELMEGGDLLSYLRASRPTATCSQRLSLPDMVSMCLDVGKGCEYLEDLHFVHRDLAARNCLISLTDSGHIVKIGDFGLARDIYKNDYYRKEGEGLLPVRWMSPESLIDGVFTTPSDVWAFGVLMWEVLTLGQQPYPARTNTEVLHFVRSGGRLDRPDNCPDDLYHLMLKCWLYVPHTRPSFKYLVQQLCGFMLRSADPADAFSGRQLQNSGDGSRTIPPRRHLDCPTSSEDSSSSSGHRESHRVPESLESVPPGARHKGTLVEHARSRSTGDHHDSTYHASGYLEPLVTSNTMANPPTKYLELLGSGSSPTTTTSMPHIGGILGAKRHSRAIPKLDYTPLVCEADESAGNFLNAAARENPQSSRFSAVEPLLSSQFINAAGNSEVSYVPARRAAYAGGNRVWPSPVDHHRVRSTDSATASGGNSPGFNSSSKDFYPLLNSIRNHDKGHA